MAATPMLGYSHLCAVAADAIARATGTTEVRSARCTASFAERNRDEVAKSATNPTARA